MSRIAAALWRAGLTSPAISPTPGDDSGSIQFFDPNQQAVLTASEVVTGPVQWPSVRSPQRQTGPDGPSPTALVPSVQRRFFTDLPPRDSMIHRPQADAKRLELQRNMTAQGREQCRKLAATLYQTQLARGVKVVLVTSAAPGEGKTFTAANLALTFSESQRRRVLLIDADLRGTMVHEAFRVSNARGLADSLSKDIPMPLIRATAGLFLLTAGQGGGDPMETLTSDRFSALLQEARAVFDWILLDTPPAGLVSDAKVLASLADATVLVVLAKTTPYDAVQGAIATLGTDRIAGVVLNRVATSALAYADADQYYLTGRR